MGLGNRSDVHGGYRSESSRRPDPGSGRPLVSFTAHCLLTLAMLVRHFVGEDRGHLVGLHVSSPAETCKWIVLDLDAHGPGDDPEANRRMALSVYAAAGDLGLDVLLLDSNGGGGFHLWVVFARPVQMADAWRLGKWLVRDYATFGLTKPPESFPKGPRLTGKRIGQWVRLPGRHHTRDHWTRVWGDGRWLEGSEAVAAILAVGGRDVDIPALIPADFSPGGVGHDVPNHHAVAALLDGRDRGRDVALARAALGSLRDEHRDDYDRWLRVGMALADLGDAGLALWHAWSEPSAKYDSAVLDEKWTTFTPGDGITLGTLFHEAREAGWAGPTRKGAGFRPVGFTVELPWMTAKPGGTS